MMLKAELEISKRALFNLVIALALAIAGIIFLTCGMGLMLYAVYLVFIPLFDHKWMGC
jgi:hypothetical protein